MDRTKAEPKPLGRCIYCTLPVTDQNGQVLQAGACFHYRCSREQNRPTFRTIDFLEVVIAVEMAISHSPKLVDEYWHNLPEPFISPAYASLVRRLIDLSKQEGLKSVAQKLERQLKCLQKLYSSAN